MTKRILFVDDMEEMHGRVRILFSRRGYKVDYVKTAEEAIEKINSGDIPYYAVVTDFELGRGSSLQYGTEVIRAARKRDPSTLVVLISMENHEEEAITSGADEFLFKKELLSGRYLL